MPPQLEEYIAEFDENTFTTSHPADLEGGDKVWSLTSNANGPRPGTKCNAYSPSLLPKPFGKGSRRIKHDLPTLLAKGKDRNVVAYRGEKRLGIAPTRELLLAQLYRSGGAQSDPDVYIKKIRRPDDGDDMQSYSGQTR